MNIKQQVHAFISNYYRVPNASGHQPVWIYFEFQHYDSWVLDGLYDFKNDEARRAFGALCHSAYMSKDQISIHTFRE